MSKLNISDNTNISMPVRNMLAIIGAVAMGVWAYFGVMLGLFLLYNIGIKYLSSRHCLLVKLNNLIP